MAIYPQSEADITARLNTIETLLESFLADPSDFAEKIAGSIKISVPQYVQALQVERDHWVSKLENLPYFEDSDMDSLSGFRNF